MRGAGARRRAGARTGRKPSRRALGSLRTAGILLAAPALLGLWLACGETPEDRTAETPDRAAETPAAPEAEARERDREPVIPPPLGRAEPRTTVTAEVQPRPGADPEPFDMPVYEVPVDPPTVPAADAELDDADLVLGLVVDGEAVAYPIRYLALYEVVNDRVGEATLAPSW